MALADVPISRGRAEPSRKGEGVVTPDLFAMIPLDVPPLTTWDIVSAESLGRVAP
jgi:hypothetical protein